MEESTLEKYSFTKLNAFHTCKYMYKLRYIDNKKGIGNAFSSYGSEVHSIMERFAKGELELWDLANVFEWEFDSAIPEPFPKNKYCDLKETYYKQGLAFLKNFPGYSKYKILGVEESFEIKIDDWMFNGIVDLIYEDENGDLIILDYKSKASFKSKEEQAHYALQLYLYAMHVKEKYGKYPKALQFSMFRKQNIVTIPFDETQVENAVEWAKSTVKEIRECWDYSPTCSGFFGNNLCNHREYCEFKVNENE